MSIREKERERNYLMARGYTLFTASYEVGLWALSVAYEDKHKAKRAKT